MLPSYYYVIDTSYLVFFAGSAVFNSYADDQGLSKSEMYPELDPTADPEYCYMLSDAIKNILLKNVQKFDVFPNTSRFIFCRDCSRSNLWRRDIYPDYKMNRDTKDHSKDKFDIGKVFNYAYDHTLPEIVAEFKCTQVQCGCAEADDAIAVMTRHILSLSPNNHVVILTSDRDMVQLCGDRVHLVTAKGEERHPKEDLQKMTKTELDGEYDARDFLLFKILVGDPSDNIPNVKPKLGPKTALKYIHDT